MCGTLYPLLYMSFMLWYLDSLSFLHFLTPHVLTISLILLCVYDDVTDNESSDDNIKQQHGTVVNV
jgi:hypothetical protein